MEKIQKPWKKYKKISGVLIHSIKVVRFIPLSTDMQGSVGFRLESIWFRLDLVQNVSLSISCRLTISVLDMRNVMNWYVVPFIGFVYYTGLLYCRIDIIGCTSQYKCGFPIRMTQIFEKLSSTIFGYNQKSPNTVFSVDKGIVRNVVRSVSLSFDCTMHSSSHTLFSHTIRTL